MLKFRQTAAYLTTVVLFFLAATAILVASPRNAHAQTTAGRITSISGGVTVTRGTASIPGTFNMTLDVGDRIVTASNGRATITLVDNSQIEVTENSTLELTQNIVNPNGTRASTQVTLLGGLARSLVRFTAGTPPNFEVHTPNAVASARGTTYDTDYEKGATREGYKDCTEFTDVSVYDGTVVVSNPTNPTAPPVEVHSGQKTTVPCGLGPIPPGEALGALGLAGLGLGGAIVVGGVVGGLAGAGAFGGGGNGQGPPPHPRSPLR